jgi:Protein phosphatase 2C
MTADESSWRSVAERSVGTSHRSTSVPCQDQAIVDMCADESGQATALVAAVADGAGSASESERGASQAVSYAVAYIKRHFTAGMSVIEVGGIVRESMLHARAEIIRAAEQEQRCVRDYSTTLLVALVSDRVAAFGQVGDGAIVFGDSASLELAFAVEQEMLNVTDFLTDDAAPEIARSRAIEGPIDMLAVLSDGLSPLLIDQRLQRPHAPAFASLFGHVARTADASALSEDLRAFLDSSAVNDRTDDDKSLVLAVRMRRS